MGKCRTIWQNGKKTAESKFAKLGIKFELGKDGFGPSLDETEEVMGKLEKADPTKKDILEAEFRKKFGQVAVIAKKYTNSIESETKAQTKNGGDTGKKAASILDDLQGALLQSMTSFDNFSKKLNRSRGTDKPTTEIKLKFK